MPSEWGHTLIHTHTHMHASTLTSWIKMIQKTRCTLSCNWPPGLQKIRCKLVIGIQCRKQWCWSAPSIYCHFIGLWFFSIQIFPDYLYGTPSSEQLLMPLLADTILFANSWFCLTCYCSTVSLSCSHLYSSLLHPSLSSIPSIVSINHHQHGDQCTLSVIYIVIYCDVWLYQSYLEVRCLFPYMVHGTNKCNACPCDPIQFHMIFYGYVSLTWLLTAKITLSSPSLIGSKQLSCNSGSCVLGRYL